jgi:alcohol dehydrogenase
LVAATRRFGDIARALGEHTEGLSEIAAAERAIAAVKALSEDIGIPKFVDQLGISRKGIPAIAKDGMTNSRQILPNPRDVTYEGLIGILNEAFSPV